MIVQERACPACCDDGGWSYPTLVILTTFAPCLKVLGCDAGVGGGAEQGQDAYQPRAGSGGAAVCGGHAEPAAGGGRIQVGACLWLLLAQRGDSMPAIMNYELTTLSEGDGLPLVLC